MGGSFGEVQLDAVDRPLDPSHHQEVFVLQSVEVQAQRGSLELHLAHQQVVLQQFHFV